jgi:outer membrane protein assembly factor BamB
MMHNPSPEAKSVAESSAGPTKPLWQAKLTVQETDFIEFVSKDRVLVGTVNTHDLAGGLQPHEIILLNSATGEKVWTVPRRDYGSPQTLLAFHPVIIVEGSKQIVGLNPENGAQIWNRERAGQQSLLLPQRDLIVLLNRKAAPLTLSAVNVKTGHEAWSTQVENYALDKNTKLDITIMGDAVLLSGPEVAAFSTSEGKLLWRTPFPGAYGPKAATISPGDDLYFSDESAIRRADPASGKEIWRASTGGDAFQSLTANEGSVFFLLKGGGAEARDSIAAFDRAGEKQLWKCELPDRAASPMSVAGDRFYVTTPGDVLAMKVSDGSVVFKSEIPSNLQSRKQLPDYLRITNDRIIVAREDGVLEVQKTDGKFLFCDEVIGGQGFTYDYSANRFRHATMNMKPRSKKHPLKATPDSQTPEDNYRVAMVDQRAADEWTRRYYQTQSTNQINLINQATSVQVPGQSSPEYFAPRTAMVATAVVGAASGLAAGLSALGEARRIGSYRARVQKAFETHASSVQGNYYVRPAYVQHQGWSLHLVNLESGEHADILLSADADLNPDGFAANLPAFSLDGSRIVSKGLGANPGRPPEHQKLFRMPILNVDPSVLAFDLASIRFEPCSKSPVSPAKPVESATESADDDLLAAAYRNDVEAIRKALDSGANINTTSEYGATPLMLAAEASPGSKNANAVKLLLERGADPNIRDPGGLTAFEHVNLLTSVATKGFLSAQKQIRRAQKIEE